MGTYKRICILGNYSGRNAGDAALLAGILREISSRYKSVEFLVPTLNPRFVKKYCGGYRVRPVSLLPWNGCIKLLGLPVWNAMRSSDLILITDAVLFDRGLFNPLHNYLSSLALLIPLAKKRGVPVVLYNVSLGPARAAAGQWCLRRVLNHSDLVILRDEDSRRMLEVVGDVRPPVARGADSALSAPCCSPDRIRTILQENGVWANKRSRVGINLNDYGDSFIRNGHSHYSKAELLATLSKIAEWIVADLKADVWLIATQHMDVKILQEFQKTIRSKEKLPLFTNQRYSYAELAGLFSQLDLLIGMRTHALILASSVGTPVVGLATYPKTYGYLHRIGQETYSISIQDVNFDKLQNLIRQNWERRSLLRQDIVQAIGRERKLAWQAADFLAPYLGG